MKTIASPYSLTGIKSFRGMEGLGLNATLLRDGKKVAFIMDDGNGGEYRFEFGNPTQRREGRVSREEAQREETAFATFCLEWYRSSGQEQHDREQNDKWNEGKSDPVPFTIRPQYVMEVWVGRFVDEYESAKRLAKLAKKKTLFRIKGETYKDGEWSTLAEPYGPRVQAYFDKKYPGKVAEIYGVALIREAA